MKTFSICPSLYFLEKLGNGEVIILKGVCHNFQYFGHKLALGFVELKTKRIPSLENVKSQKCYILHG